jgi:membrane-bound inhibitor of C-type lysozyme
MRVSLKLAHATALALVATTLSAHATTAQYRCKSGTRFNVEFSPPSLLSGRATLTFVGTKQKVVLPQVMSADGGRYANGQMEFWIKGRQATLTRDGKGDLCTTR